MTHKSEESSQKRSTKASSPKGQRRFIVSHRVLLLLFFIGAVCVGFWGFYHVQDTRKRELSEARAIHCLELAREFDKFIRNQESRIEWLLSEISALLEPGEVSTTSSFVDRLETEIAPLLKSVVANCAELDACFLHLNPQIDQKYFDITYVKGADRSIRRLPSLAKEEYDKANPSMVWFFTPLSRKVPGWSEVFYLDALEDHLLSYSAPVLHNGKPIAVVGIFVRLHHLIERVARISDSDDSFGFLLNSERVVLYHPDYAKGILFEHLEPVDLVVLDEALSKGPTLSPGVWRDRSRLLTFAKLANGWILGFDVSFGNTGVPFHAIAVFVIGIGLIVLLSALIFGYIYNRSIFKPLALLSETTTRFSQGESDARYLGPTSGPIGQLGVSFNEFADHLTNRLATIRRQNEDISAINQELEAMNQQLQESYNVSEELTASLHKTIALTSRSSLSTFESQHSFLKEALDTILMLLPKADYGTIYTLTRDVFSIVSFVGHRFSRYYQIPQALLPISQTPFLVDNSLGLPGDPEELKRYLPELYLRERKSVEQTLGVYLQVAGEVQGLITLDIARGRRTTFSEAHKEIIHSFANIVSSFLAIRTFAHQSEGFQKEIILSFIKILELYDPYTQGHSEAVALLSSMIAEELRIDATDFKRVYWAGLVHDIGKILVPSDILKKKSALTKEEYTVIQKHPQWGAEVLHSSEKLKEIAEYVLFHHERWDGTGYPIGLSGEEIPYISRIISIADALDAMTSDRPYRKGMGVTIAFQELERGAGSQFDPDLVRKILGQPACRERVAGIIQNKRIGGI